MAQLAGLEPGPCLAGEAGTLVTDEIGAVAALGRMRVTVLNLAAEPVLTTVRSAHLAPDAKVTDLFTERGGWATCTASSWNWRPTRATRCW